MYFNLLKFIKNISFFLVLFTAIFFLIIYLIDFNTRFGLKSKAIYIWGDSQIYQGINLKRLKEKGLDSVFSAAQHGAGVYDFSVFCSKVPRQSTVFIGFSTFAFIRKKKNDKNQSGFSLMAFNLLLQNNYSFSEAYSIYNHNLFPKNIFHQKFGVNQNADSIVYIQSISLFKELIKASDSYFSSKANVFISGLNILVKKKCKIIIIETPLHKELDTILIGTTALNKLINLRNNVISNYNLIDTSIVIQADSNIMYDLTHLNERGSSKLSDNLVNFKNLKDKNYFIQFKKK